jgi:opacity protein-like surface antigen
MTPIERSANRAWFAVIVFAAIAPVAQAQTTSTVEWRRGTTLSGFVGAASAATDTDAAAGLSVGWEVTPRFGVEGRGIWLRAGDTEDAFAATLAARVAIRPGHPIVPFASAGVGLYRASFDAPAGVIPDFYRTRVTSTGLGGQTFTDFALSFGGGADFFVTRHLAVRPEVNVLLATTRTDVRAMTIYGAQLAYHFESLPITPQPRE